MDENSTPEPGAETPRPATGETPPPPPPPSSSHEQPTAGGPRVTGAEIRDVARLRRSATDKHIAGVAGGLARHLDIDPLLVRIGFVVFTVFGGAGIVLYGALWLLVPDETDDKAVINLDDRSRSVAVLGAGALALLTFVGNAVGGFGADPDGGFFFPLIPVVIVAWVAWLVLRRRERRATAFPANPAVGPVTAASTDPRNARSAFNEDVKAHPEKYQDINSWKFTGDPQTGYRWVRNPRKRGPLLFWIVLPLIALALGILGVVDLAGAHVIPAAYPALALTIVAGGLLLGSLWGRAGGLILLGLLLVPATAVATIAPDIEGEQVRYAPTSTSEIPESGYRLGAGELVIDLTRLSDIEALDGRAIKASLDVGEIEIIVPDDVDVTARAWTHGPGGYEVFGHEGGGIDTRLTQTRDVTDDVAQIRIEADVSVGHIIVRSK